MCSSRWLTMLKLIFIFVIGIAYAAQTRIKIGSQSWGYQIELNQGRNVRTEFGDDEGVATGTYLYKTDSNQTKKLEYRIDPNRMEPDISFQVTDIPSNDVSKSSPDVNSTNSEISSNSTVPSNSTNSANSNALSERSPGSNMTFESIDSKQDFRGHVTIKVGNSTYNINFVTGDKSHTREETLNPNGVMFGRFSYVLKNSSTKLVINYKFNSTSPDPTFEVSLYKTIEAETPAVASNYQPFRDSNYARQLAHQAYQRNLPSHHPAYNAIHERDSRPVSSPGSGNTNRDALPQSSRPQSYPAVEKYRSPQNSVPNWYNYNRPKPSNYDP